MVSSFRIQTVNILMHSDSAALIQVICLQIDSYLNHWSQQEKYTFDRKISNVELEEGFADLYMKAFCGRELELIEDGKSRMVHVVKENPQVKLILEKKGKGWRKTVASR